MSARRRVALQLALAGAIGLAGIVGLEWWMRRGNQELVPLHVGRAPVRAELSRAGDFGVSPGTIVLVGDGAVIPAQAVPVLLVLADGRIVVRRPAPMPTAPGRTAVATSAVVLPARSLPQLQPVQRAALLEAVGALLPERPLGSQRIELAGVGGGAADVAALLDWLR